MNSEGNLSRFQHAWNEQWTPAILKVADLEGIPICEVEEVVDELDELSRD